MRWQPLVLTCAAIASAACAADSAASRTSPHFALGELAAPDAGAGAESWSVIDPATTVEKTTVVPRATASAEAWEHHVSLLYGQRELDDEWDSLDEPTVIGLEFDGSETDSGNGFEVGVQYTNEDDDIDVPPFTSIEGELTTWELYAGYRYTFMQEEQWHPFFSLGGLAMNAELDVDAGPVDERDDDTVLGAYLRAGILWDISERFRLGLDYRHVFAEDFEGSLGGVDVEAESDYDQVVLSAGFLY